MKRTGTQVLSKIYVFLRMIPNFAVHCHNLVQLTCYQTATCSLLLVKLGYHINKFICKMTGGSINRFNHGRSGRKINSHHHSSKKQTFYRRPPPPPLLLHRRWTTVLLIIINERIMVVAATLTRPSSMVTGISTTIGLVTTMMLDTGQMGGIELI